ncbi:Hypothetical predicted protein [Octopus vulgaris]|uniref:Uncharacterized protein n=1 Tax=Octopus vulgaris TaxID=6645 RepID=A0AA36B8P5_OCTVU|nr:Hypothetical predicted protein [Octopus vulgaris]
MPTQLTTTTMMISSLSFMMMLKMTIQSLTTKSNLRMMMKKMAQENHVKYIWLYISRYAYTNKHCSKCEVLTGLFNIISFVRQH